MQYYLRICLEELTAIVNLRIVGVPTETRKAPLEYKQEVTPLQLSFLAHVFTKSGILQILFFLKKKNTACIMSTLTVDVHE
jgi:hypothetical protein